MTVLGIDSRSEFSILLPRIVKILWVEFTQNYTFFLEIPLGPHWFKKKKKCCGWRKERKNWVRGDQQWGWGTWVRWGSVSNWFCLYCRDQSASATYYFNDQYAAETMNKTWLYFKTLKQGEDEETLRNEQVHCSKSRGVVVTEKGICKMVTFAYLTLHRASCVPHACTSQYQKIYQRILWIITFP